MTTDIGPAGAGWCAFCDRALSGAEAGWISVRVTFNRDARVHTLCRSQFVALPLEEQKRRAELGPYTREHAAVA